MTRVPDDLRSAVVRAVDQGASTAALRRELGVTAKQVVEWRRNVPAPLLEDLSGCRESARVFNVVDGPERAGASVSGDIGEALELRLGAWSIVIRSTFP